MKLELDQRTLRLLMRKFAIAPKAVFKEITRAMKDASKPIVAAARAQVPKETGTLRASISSLNWRKTRYGAVGSMIGVKDGERATYKTKRGLVRRASKRKVAEGLATGTRRAVKYAFIVERGSKVRTAKTRNGKPLATPANRGRMPAQPFLKPSFDLHAIGLVNQIEYATMRGISRMTHG